MPLDVLKQRFSLFSLFIGVGASVANLLSKSVFTYLVEGERRQLVSFFPLFAVVISLVLVLRQ